MLWLQNILWANESYTDFMLVTSIKNSMVFIYKKNEHYAVYCIIWL